MAIKIMDSFEPAGSGFKVVDAKDIAYSGRNDKDLEYVLDAVRYLLGLKEDCCKEYEEEHKKNSAKSVAEISEDILGRLRQIVGEDDADRTTDLSGKTLKDLKNDLTTVKGETKTEETRYIRLTKDFGKHKVGSSGYVDVEIPNNTNITDVILSAFRDVETEYSDLITDPSISFSYPSSINVEYGDHTATIPFSITINKGKYKYGAIYDNTIYSGEDSIGINYSATVYDEASQTNYNVSYKINGGATIRKTINNASRKLDASVSISNYIAGYSDRGIVAGTRCPITDISYEITYNNSDNGKNARYALNNLGGDSGRRIEIENITHDGGYCDINVYKPIFYGYFTDDINGIFSTIKGLKANWNSGDVIRNISGITKTNSATRPTSLATAVGMKYILMLFPSDTNDNPPSTVTFTNTSNGSGLDVKTAAYNITITTIDGKRNVPYKAFYVANPSATGNANTYNITYT